MADFELTPALTRALEAAQRRAIQSGTSAVEPLHLLRGLLEEEEGRAAGLLIASGIAPENLRTLAPPASPTTGAGAALPLSPQLQSVLEAARTIRANLTADRTLASEHALLALVSSQTDLRQLLESQGLRFERLRTAVLDADAPPLVLDEPLRLAEPVEDMDTARVLDANANRAREALRVVEDYCRFVLADRLLSSRLRSLRHGLTSALASLPARQLVAARDTQRDVGTGLSTRQERERHSLLEVALVNFRRLGEALRVLEEFGKLRSPDLGLALERMRYEAYTLEGAVLSRMTASQRLSEARLYVILTGSACTTALDWLIPEAAAGGARVFQLREKELSDRELLERALLVRRYTRDAGALFIMNDRPDIARLADADGVHLGQDDLPLHEARRILGTDSLIGLSTHSPDQICQAVLDGANYIGVGPIFTSTTKDFASLAGVELVRRAVAATSLPAFAIGGIHAGNIDQVIAAGGWRIAVSAAVCTADEPRAAASALKHALDQAPPG